VPGPGSPASPRRWIYPRFWPRPRLGRRG
jgi:hypothetical protein